MILGRVKKGGESVVGQSAYKSYSAVKIVVVLVCVVVVLFFVLGGSAGDLSLAE